MKKLPRQYAQTAFIVIDGVLMSILMSFALTAINTGFTGSFLRLGFKHGRWHFPSPLSPRSYLFRK
jgi:hypothetical protein